MSSIFMAHPNEILRVEEGILFQTDKWRDLYKEELGKYKLLTPGQRDGIRNLYLDREWKSLRSGSFDLNHEYDEIMQAQEIMDKLTT